MRLHPQSFSSHYAVRPLHDGDIPAIYNLCVSNPTYFLHLRESPDTESIRRDFTALPPGKTAEDKYFLGYFRENRLCAVLDLIAGYPDNETAFIGWFLLDGSLHRKGIGSAMMRELFDALKKASFRSIRLGFVEGNSESEGFWRSLGFSPTGKKSPQEAYTVVVAARDLD